MWNRFKTPVKAIFIVGIIALCLWATLPIQQKIHLGLDLQGGVRVLLQLEPTKDVPAITPQVQSQVEQVVQNRVNGLGVSEPVISKVGSNRLLVELPAVKNPDEAVSVLKDVAVLEFKIVPEKGAQPAFGPSGQPQVDFQTKNPAKFGKLTQDNLGKPLGIFLDKKFISAPIIQGVITSDGQITGNFTEDDTIRIANELNAGALPVPLTIVENDTVGPILGRIDLEKSLYASMLGLGLVLLFMIAVYRLPGLLADCALVIYVLMMLGLLAASKAVLTLPGIAGFVLSIGMAVDANVLIFERLKEELWAGKTLRAAVRTGFARAFSSVFDSHFTTIVGAGVLFLLGTGTVKGFA